MNSMAKFLIIAGVLLILTGLFIRMGLKIPFLGKMPGDIYIEKKNFVFYFPLATSIVLSLILSLILYFLFKK
ncbi:MAG: DUF2905 family protein [Candidatus Omnitrophica bacterium]|nr:DUF2905 family protein [Candidatus Omnitrophota bacterium]MBD3268675.1 DUF2905 family protein [Candidatus Omnitrophota bacterium]